MRNLHLTFLFVSTVDKSKVDILQNFVAFPKYMNFVINMNFFQTTSDRSAELKQVFAIFDKDGGGYIQYWLYQQVSLTIHTLEN